MNAARAVVTSTIFFLWAFSTGAATLAPGDAVSHVGESATVCGVVASAKFASSSRAQPTFLDFDKPYPDQVFTAVIYGVDRAKFGMAKTSLQGKRVCVSGPIREDRAKPEIILNDPRQLAQ